MAEVNKVGKKNFYKNLAKIPPCYATEDVYSPKKYATYLLNLHPNHGFIWDKEEVGNKTLEEGAFRVFIIMSL